MYIIISIVLAVLALAFLLIPLLTKRFDMIKIFGSVALSCLLLCVGCIAGSFFVKPETEKRNNYIKAVECIEEGSELYAIEAIWV